MAEAMLRASWKAKVVLPAPSAPPSRSSSPWRMPPAIRRSSAAKPVEKERWPGMSPLRTLSSNLPITLVMDSGSDSSVTVSIGRIHLSSCFPQESSSAPTDGQRGRGRCCSTSLHRSAALSYRDTHQSLPALLAAYSEG
ncbi:MAG: hypothetical protein AVDCRST_MAG93-5254 [uncultured Chloroflexia bacterium]|uniref:Uncharacterized protein n=1 Tax=uncultured Chloroflexia bacterium TaxID=1672391 RepID=A0A6J4KRK4_9CHLR|nr:MAG: hypothetical protein AVDCRST_MAG93-5254 [uncultured Chloroflexia bacterium]